MSKQREMNDAKRFDDEVFVALFRKGAHAYLENDLLADLSEQSSTAQPGSSDIADKKIEKMIRHAIRTEKRKRRIKRLPRIAATVLIVAAVCSVAIMSVDALRVPLFNLFIDTKEEITTIKIDEEQSNSINSLAYSLGYIPEGYELVSEENMGQSVILVFTNEIEENIFIERYSEEGSSGIDTEIADYDNIIINEKKGFYATKNGETTLVFTNNKYTYFITASIDLSEIIKIAENIK